MSADSIPNVHLRRAFLVFIAVFVIPFALVWVGISKAAEEARYLPTQYRTLWSRDFRGHW